MIINQPDFINCFPRDLLSNILPLSDIKQNAIERNSINYLENLIDQQQKLGLRKDKYLERRLKIQDLIRIVMKFYANTQLANSKLEGIIFEMMTIPISARESVETDLTEKNIRDSLKKLDIELKQDIKHILFLLIV